MANTAVVFNLVARDNLSRTLTQVSAQMERLQQRVERLDRQRATISVRVDERGAMGKLERIVRQVNGIGPAAIGATRGMGMLFSQTSVMAAAAAPAIGLVSTALLSLPAAASVGVGAFAALKMGMNGFGDAIKQANTPAELKAQNEALAKLAPAARATATAINQLRPAWHGIQQVTQQHLFAGMAQQMHALVPLMGLLKTSFAGIADALNADARAFIGVITSSIGMARIQQIGQGIARVLAGLAPMIRQGTQAFLLLAQIGVQSMGPLVRVLNTFAGEFNNLVHTLAASGVLQQAFAGLAQVLGAVLHVFNQVLGAGVRAMAQLAGPLSQAIRVFGDMFVAIMPALTAFTNLLLAVLTPLMRALTPLFKMLAPIITALIGPFTAVANLLVAAVQPILKATLLVITKIVQAFGPVFVGVIKALMPLVQALSGAFLDIVKSLLPIIPPLARVAKELIPMITQVVKALVPVIKEEAQAWVGIFKAIMPILPKLADLAVSILQLAVKVLPVLTFFTTNVVVPVLKLMAKIVTAVLSFGINKILIPAIESLTKIVQTIGRIWTDIWNGIKKAFNTVKNFIIDGIATIIMAFLNFVSTLIHGAADAFGWVPGVGPMLQGAARKFDKFKDGVNTALQGIKDRHVQVDATGKWSNAALVAQGTRHLSPGSAYATGGGVFGPGTGTSDSILAALSNGEHVWTAQEVQGAGGHAAVAHLRSLAMAKKIPGFAAGGVVTNVTGNPGDITPSGNRWLDEQITRWAKKLAQTFMQITGDTGVRSASAAAAQAYARAAMGRFGWGPGQWAPLAALWNRESGWNAFAVNRSSGAYGIPQSLGHGRPYALGDYVTQVNWGLNYIAGRYHTPAVAWAHERAFGWYGKGLHNAVFDRPTLIGVGESGAERVDVTPLNGGKRSDDPPVVINVYPREGHSEEEIAAIVERRLSFALR